jgi:hypothetical protein
MWLTGAAPEQHGRVPERHLSAVKQGSDDAQGPQLH